MCDHMNKTFTQDDIIRFIYGEMNQEESVLFKCSLQSDTKLNESYHSLKTQWK